MYHTGNTSQQIPTANSSLLKDSYHRVFALQGSFKFFNAAILKVGHGCHFWTGRQNKYCDGSKQTDFIKFLVCSINCRDTTVKRLILTVSHLCVRLALVWLATSSPCTHSLLRTPEGSRTVVVWCLSVRSESHMCASPLPAHTPERPEPRTDQASPTPLSSIPIFPRISYNKYSNSILKYL